MTFWEPDNFDNRKDPADRLDWTIGLDKWLEEDETISTAVWATEVVSEPTDAVSSPVTIDGSLILPKDTTVWISGGVNGGVYSVSCEIVTSANRTLRRGFDIVVEPGAN